MSRPSIPFRCRVSDDARKNFTTVELGDPKRQPSVRSSRRVKGRAASQASLPKYADAGHYYNYVWEEQDVIPFAVLG